MVSQAAMEAAMEASVAKFGRPLDGLVCSAGVFEPTPIASWNTPYQDKEGTEAEFRQTMETNVMGPSACWLLVGLVLVFLVDHCW